MNRASLATGRTHCEAGPFVRASVNRKGWIRNHHHRYALAVQLGRERAGVDYQHGFEAVRALVRVSVELRSRSIWDSPDSEPEMRRKPWSPFHCRFNRQ